MHTSLSSVAAPVPAPAAPVLFVLPVLIDLIEGSPS